MTKSCHVVTEPDFSAENYPEIFAEREDEIQCETRDHFGQVLDEELEALKVWITARAPES